MPDTDPKLEGETYSDEEAVARGATALRKLLTTPHKLEFRGHYI